MATDRRCKTTWIAALLALLLAACGGGGPKPVDVVPSTAFPPPTPVAGPDSFLLWVNPLRTPDGQPPPIDSPEYATAYYAAIDPMGKKKTLTDWRRENSFDAPGGIVASAVFGDFRDLGYGRRMTGRCDSDGATPPRCAPGGRVAFLVENFLVNPGAEGYGARINLDAAVVDDRQWIVSINAIEFGPSPDRYARFYSFNPLTQARVLTQNLDGRGEKALPGACISCHGGRADALEPAPGGGWQMPLLHGSLAGQRGDVRGRLHPFEVDALTFSGASGATAAQQAALKAMNRMVLCTYPLGTATAPADDACRDAAVTGEWQGGAAQVIKDAYAGATPMSSATYNTPFPVPTDWQGSAGTVVKSDLYRQVVAPACLACHRLLGSSLQSDIDFASFTKFASFDQRTRDLVFEHGNMPLSRVAFGRFWSSDPADGKMARKLADYLAANAQLAVPRDASGDPRLPGAPVAIAGPDRRVNFGPSTLSAKRSLFADSYQWALKQPVAGVTLTNASASEATLTTSAASAGQLVELTLVASRGGVSSAAAELKVYVNTTAQQYPAPSFAQIKLLLPSCTGCHASAPTASPKLAFDSADDGVLFAIVRSRINFNDLAASQLLRKPSSEHHDGNSVLGWCTRVGPDRTGVCNAVASAKVAPGDPQRASADIVINWALAGAPR